MPYSFGQSEKYFVPFLVKYQWKLILAILHILSLHVCCLLYVHITNGYNLGKDTIYTILYFSVIQHSRLSSFIIIQAL